MAAVCLGVSTLLTANLAAFTAVVTAGCAAIVMFGNTHGGSMPDVIEDKHYSQVGGIEQRGEPGGCGTVCDAGGGAGADDGRAGGGGVAGADRDGADRAAVLYPAAQEEEAGSARDVQPFLRGPVPGVPAAGMHPGADLLRFADGVFCADQPVLRRGLGLPYAGAVGDGAEWAGHGDCLLAGVPGGDLGVRTRYVRRTVYILTGFGGAAAALGLIRTPHTLLFYAAGVLMYDFFTGINYTAFTSLEYEIVGSGNPLASTQFALLSASGEPADQLHDGGGWALPHDAWAGWDAGRGCAVQRGGGDAAADGLPQDWGDQAGGGCDCGVGTEARVAWRVAVGRRRVDSGWRGGIF